MLFGDLKVAIVGQKKKKELFPLARVNNKSTNSTGKTINKSSTKLRSRLGSSGPKSGLLPEPR